MPDGVLFSLSPRYSKGVFQRDDYDTVLMHLSVVALNARLRSRLQPNADGVPLSMTMLSFDYVIIDALRYYASSRALKPVSSLVEVTVDNMGSTWVGELLDIIHTVSIRHLMVSLRWDAYVGSVHLKWTSEAWSGIHSTVFSISFIFS